jgi:uncharacterized membrane protein
MALRLHEVHPSLVHYPLVLFPASVLADLLGRLTGSRALMSLGARLMPIAAGSAMVTGAAGLVAQEAVKAEGQAHELLATHRNMNLSLIGLAVAMSVLRARKAEPGTGYLLAGLGAVAAMNFTAYLGGKMVYAHGVGVRPAGGLDETRSPEIGRASLRETARRAGEQALGGMRHAASDLRKGEIAPALRNPAKIA